MLYILALFPIWELWLHILSTGLGHIVCLVGQYPNLVDGCFPFGELTESLVGHDIVPSSQQRLGYGHTVMLLKFVAMTSLSHFLYLK